MAAITGPLFTSMLAGGGIKGGVVHGSSDRYAAYPATNPTPPADLAAPRSITAWASTRSGSCAIASIGR